MLAFNTIHVFGFGDVQLIGEKKGTIKADTMTTLTAFVDHVKTFKPEAVVESDYHVIHLFGGTEVRYLGKGTENTNDKTMFTVNVSELDATIYGDFINELDTAIPAEA
jgi:hypothetical protein